MDGRIYLIYNILNPAQIQYTVSLTLILGQILYLILIDWVYANVKRRVQQPILRLVCQLVSNFYPNTVKKIFLLPRTFAFRYDMMAKHQVIYMYLQKF